MDAVMNLSLSIPVVAGWGVWLTVGLMLVVWARSAREARLQGWARESAARTVPARPKSGVRLPKPTPPSVDAFGELQTLLDSPQSAARRPGD